MEKFRIQGLHLSGIGAFQNIDLQFPEKINNNLAEIHIFSGENGTGKSTLLEALSCFDNNSQFLTPKIHSPLSNQAAIQIDFTIKYESQILHIEVYSTKFVDGKWTGINRLSSFFQGFYTKINNFNYSKFDFAFFAYSGYRRLVQGSLGAIQEVNTNPLMNALNFNQSIDPQLLIQWIANTKTKEALSLTKGETIKAAQYKNSIARIEKIIADITDQKISFELEDNPLAVSIKADGVKLQFDTLPDGLKSIISWIADLLMRMDRLSWNGDTDIFDRRFILFLDEIEVHLHPKWQRKILPVIQKLFTNAQIFVSTHSPFIIGSIDNAWIYKFEKKGAYSQLALPPFLSEDANSYRMILEEIFDINKQFGIEVERRLDEFYQLKSQILNGDTVNIAEFNELARNLASQSNELESIIGMEIKQIKKLKGAQFEMPL
jgi:predicted ATP-binding protein involved in virulence